MIEIRWHGRGGQGVVTASELLVETAILEGKYIQSFPEFGPERMGAPIKAYTRIDANPIDIHTQIYNPDIVMILDASLIGTIDVLEGLKENGIVIVDSTEDPEVLKKRMNMTCGTLYRVDATQIALDTLKRAITNTPMLGALIKATGIVDIAKLTETANEKFSEKFKKEVVEGNLAAIKRAYEEAKAS